MVVVMSLRRPGSHLVVGLAPDTDFDAQRMHRQCIDKVREYEEYRQSLMEAAKVGNKEAARILWERWRFRWTQ